MMQSQTYQNTVKNTSNNNYISICIPTHPVSTSQHIQEDIIRFKNAIKSLRDDLGDNENMQDVLDDIALLQDNNEFWKKQSKSLLITADEDNITIDTLPIEIDEFYVAGPLPIHVAKTLTNIFNQELYLLHISLDGATLYKKSDGGLVETDLSVTKRADLLEQDHETNQQFYSPSGNRSGTPKFHGHGGSKDLAENTTNIYLSYIAREIESYISKEDLPMILAGDESSIALFRKHFKYSKLRDVTIQGNHEHKSIAHLDEQLDKIIREESLQAIHANIDEFKNAKSSMQVVGYDAITDSLSKGSIKTLYIPSMRYTNDSVRDGVHKEMKLTLPDDVMNIQIVVDATLQQGGNIVPVEIDSFEDLRLRALLRY